MKWWLFCLIVSSIMGCLLAIGGLALCGATVSRLMTPYFMMRHMFCSICNADDPQNDQLCQLWCSGGCIVHVDCFE